MSHLTELGAGIRAQGMMIPHLFVLEPAPLPICYHLNEPSFSPAAKHSGLTFGNGIPSLSPCTHPIASQSPFLKETWTGWNKDGTRAECGTTSTQVTQDHPEQLQTQERTHLLDLNWCKDKRQQSSRELRLTRCYPTRQKAWSEPITILGKKYEATECEPKSTSHSLVTGIKMPT